PMSAPIINANAAIFFRILLMIGSLPSVKAVTLVRFFPIAARTQYMALVGMSGFHLPLRPKPTDDLSLIAGEGLFNVAAFSLALLTWSYISRQVISSV